MMKLYLKSAVFALPMLLLSAGVFAQAHDVKGKVLDEESQPIPGANVMIKGTTTGTITAGNGEFTLKANDGDVLQISYIGYMSEEVTVNGAGPYNVSLSPDMVGLEEVVVVGYGAMKKSDISGSVVSVNSEEMMRRTPINITQGLQGVAPGVMVTQQDGSPDGNSAVRIRGIATINGSADPLYVVDGVQVGTNANFLNPADIESIEVLKDASATAIYGSAGANGVIMITTKHGQKGKMKVTASADWGVQTLPYKIETLGIDDYAKSVRAAKGNDGLGIYNKVWAEQYDGKRNYIDWQDQMTQNAMRQQYNISANGGTDASQYNFSVGFANNDGLVVNTNYKRLTARASVKTKVNSYLEVGGDINFINTGSYGSNQGFSNNGNLSSLRDFAYLTPTLDYVEGNSEGGKLINVNVVNPDGTYGIGYQTTSDGWEGNTKIAGNFYASQMEQSGKSKNNRVLASAFAEITFFKGLTLRTLGSYTYFSSNWSSFSGGQRRFNIIDGKYEEIELSGDTRYTYNLSQSQGNTLQLSTYMTYKWNNDVHNINAMIGNEISKYYGDWVSASASDFISETNRQTSLSTNDDTKKGSGGQNADVRGLSYFGRLTYSLLDRYILTATVRKDGSSNFGEGNRWGTFPSAAVAWRISEEDFMQDVSAVSNLKLRLGWGQTGNAGNMTGKAVAALSSANIAYNYYSGNNREAGYWGNRQKNVGMVPSLVDTKLKWETNEQTNIGVDLGLLDGTVTATFDYFIRKTTDLLLYQQIRPSAGYTSVYTNYGEILNKGVEFSVTYNKRVNDDLSFNVTFNGSSLKNEVKKMGEPLYSVNDGSTNDGSNVGAVGAASGFHWDNHSICTEGEAVGSFYGYHVEGIFQSQDEVDKLNATAVANGFECYQQKETQAGDYKFKDMNGDGHIDSEDMDILGNGLPKLNYGINIGANYKNWDMSIYCYGVAGQKVYSYSAMRLSNMFSSDDQTTPNLLKESYDDAWSPENKGGSISRLSWQDKNYNMRGSDKWVKKADFLRISNIQIGYNFPKEWLQPLQIQAARAYASVSNLAVISQYKKYGDPECGQGSVLFTGLDTGRYPMPRTFQFGVNIQF